MKKNLKHTSVMGLVVMVVATVVSCSKKDDAPDRFSAVISQNFTDPLKNERNIQVEDYIPYTIVIDDSQKEENVEYRLISVREDQPYHQTIWKDFGLHLSSDDKTPPDVTKKYISFYKQGEHTFYIRPYVPGTFKHTYYLQKLVNGKEAGEKVKLNTIFNAVKIEVGKQLYQLSGERYYFKINDGDEETDTYFDLPAESSQWYELHTNTNKKYEGEFKPVFRNYFLYVSENPTLGGIIKYLKIKQQLQGGSEYIIEYYNIKVDL